MKELRYALVLNGGVSLAIWMGGVTHELNRLRQAQSPKFRLDDSETAVLAAWDAILNKAECTAVVDLIAGSSAGGLNGSMLATSIARGTDMPAMKNLWCEFASLKVGNLTFDSPAGAKSILRSSELRKKICSTIDLMAPCNDQYAADCILLVTATALNSTPARTVLESGAAMNTTDGRRVYKFTRRRARPSAEDSLPKNFPPVKVALLDDFNDHSDELKLAAQASASFPFAFEPIAETHALSKLHNGRVTEPCWLADGGLLDNAPFEPLLDALKERPTDRPYERVLLYVTPGVGSHTAGRDPISRAHPPGISTAASWILAAIREPDERLDRDALGHAFEQLSYSLSQPFAVISSFLKAPTKSSARFITATDCLFHQYQASRAEALERMFHSVSGSPESPLRPPLPPRIVDFKTIPGMPQHWSIPEQMDWTWGLATANRVLRWWGRAFSEAATSPTTDHPAMAAIGTAQSFVIEQYAALESAVSASAVNSLGRKVARARRSSASDAEIEQTIYNIQLHALCSFYDSGSPSVRMRLADVMRATVKAVADAFPGVSPEQLMTLTLSVEVISNVFGWSGADFDPPTFRYYNVTPAADSLVALPARLLQPPGNAEWPKKKLFGQRWNHFGAFSSHAGREHDWLWGRLDAASEISKQILHSAGVLDESEGLRRDLIAAILKSEGKTPAEVEAGALVAFDKTPGNMLADMIATEDGARTIRHLLRTVDELIRAARGRFKFLGFGTRAALFPFRTVTYFPIGQILIAKRFVEKLFHHTSRVPDQKV